MCQNVFLSLFGYLLIFKNKKKIKGLGMEVYVEKTILICNIPELSLRTSQCDNIKLLAPLIQLF